MLSDCCCSCCSYWCCCCCWWCCCCYFLCTLFHLFHFFSVSKEIKHFPTSDEQWHNYETNKRMINLYVYKWRKNEVILYLMAMSTHIHTYTHSHAKWTKKQSRRERIKLSFSLGNVYWICCSHTNGKNERQNTTNWEIKGTMKWQSDNGVVWRTEYTRMAETRLQLLIVPCSDNISDMRTDSLQIDRLQIKFLENCSFLVRTKWCYYENEVEISFGAESGERKLWIESMEIEAPAQNVWQIH